MLQETLRAAAAEGLAPNVRRWCRLIGWAPGDYPEILSLVGERAFVVHVDSPDSFAARLEEADATGKAQGIYTIANRVKPESATREPVNEWRLADRDTSTKNIDIQDRVVLYVDVDVVRETNTSATDREVEAACEVATRIYADLVALIGDRDSVAVGHSGNGVAIFVALDHLPNDEEVRRLIEDTLRAIAAIYTVSGIKIDAKVYDAKRLVPAFGTIKHKGVETPERPHRRTAILVPERVRRLSLAELRRLRDSLTQRAPTPAPSPRPAASTPAPAPVAPSGESQGALSAPSSDEGLDLGELRKLLITQRRKLATSQFPGDAEKFRIYGALVDGTALALSPTEDKARTDGEKLLPELANLPAGRSTIINQAASMLAFTLPLGTPWEAAAELLRPALAATDYQPEGIEHWLNVFRQCYERAVARDEPLRAERERKKQAQQNLREALAGAAPQKPTIEVQEGTLLHAFSETGVAPAETAGVITAGEDDSWTNYLIPTADRKIVSCTHNVYVVLACAPEYRGNIRLNLVTKDIEVKDGPLKHLGKEVFSTGVMNWLQASRYRIKMKRHEIEDQILLVATENKYDPIQEYLLGLVWDKKPRLDEFFFTHAIARLTNASGGDLSPYLRLVAPKFFISAVARALRPGEQVDTMLVLEGEKEGEGKTSMFRILFGDYYVNIDKNVDDKDAKMVPASYWGGEFGELAAMNKSMDEMLKGYLTVREDKLRLPYGRRYESFPRRIVFFGTTNNPQWLTYGKGRRRYWPVYIEQILLEQIKEDRDQLWAEAVARFQAGERWHLLNEERDLADAEADARVEATYIESKIAEWWFKMDHKRRMEHEFITLLNIVDLVFKLTPAEAAKMKSLPSDIGVAMARLKFNKGRRDRQYGWMPTPELLGRAHLKAVPRTPEEALEHVASIKVDRGLGGE